MDPSGYGQTPPPTPPPAPDAPPSWAPPGQPGWGQPVPPIPPAQPGWGQPVEPGQPGQPGWQPGQPGWQPGGMWATPVAPKRRAPILRIAGVVLILLVLAGGALFYIGLNSGVGQVMFSKSAYQTGNNCKFDAPVTEATTTDSIYMIAFFRDTLQPSYSLTLDVTKDGAPFENATDTTDTSFNCYIESQPMGPLAAGVYKLTFTHNGTVEADGTLTVK